MSLSLTSSYSTLWSAPMLWWEPKENKSLPILHPSKALILSEENTFIIINFLWQLPTLKTKKVSRSLLMVSLFLATVQSCKSMTLKLTSPVKMSNMRSLEMTAKLPRTLSPRKLKKLTPAWEHTLKFSAWEIAMIWAKLSKTCLLS